MAEHRWELIAEIGQRLTNGWAIMTPITRWSAWEKEVLFQTDAGPACQKLIVERQAQVDDDDDESILITAHFATKLKENYDLVASTDHIFIPSQAVRDWVNEATGERFKTSGATAHLKSLSIKHLEYERTNHSRGWVWKGTNCTSEKPTPLAKAKKPVPATSEPSRPW